MNIVLFDLGCLFCNKSVKYLNKLDQKDSLLFGSLNDRLIFEAQFDLVIREEDKIILIQKEQVYYGGDAILKILKGIEYYKPIIWILSMMPKYFINLCYTLIANNRYLFGRNDSCEIDQSIRSKMIDARNIKDYFNK